ncbi:hypothetical protein D3C79_817670 [compost metagenome]
MVLRDLPQRAVGLRDTGDDLGQGDVGHAGAAKGLGHADGPQAGAGEQLEFGVGQAALAVAQGAVAAQLLGDVLGDIQGFAVAGDDFCSHVVSPGPLGRVAALSRHKAAPTGGRTRLCRSGLVPRKGCRAAPRA